MRISIRSFFRIVGAASLVGLVVLGGLYLYGDYIYRSEMQDRDWRGKLAKVLAEPEVWAAKPCMPAAVFGREYCFPQDRLVLKSYSRNDYGSEHLSVIFVSRDQRDDMGKPLTMRFFISRWRPELLTTIPHNAIHARMMDWRETPEDKAMAERLFEELRPQPEQPDKLHDYTPYILQGKRLINDLLVLERNGERVMALFVDPPNGTYNFLGGADYQRKGDPYSINLHQRSNEGTREQFIQSFVTWFDEFNDFLAETRTR